MISLTVNGRQYDVDVSPDTPLLWVIRDAIDCYAKSRSESERRLIAELAGRSRARVSRRE